MLSKVTTISQSGSTTPAVKQIAIRITNNGQIVYVVPAGKTFTGIAVSMNQMEFLINNVLVFSMPAVASYQTHEFPLRLTAGTTITSGPNYPNWTLLGIEE
jgi:hypothetical protein